MKPDRLAVSGRQLSTRCTIRGFLAILCFAATGVAMAQALSSAPPINCASPQRTSDLKQVPGTQSLQDFSITFAGSQSGKLAYAFVYLFEGACAADIEAVRMTQIAFRDGAIFGQKANRQYVYMPGQKVLTNVPSQPMTATAPDIDGAVFVMASHVDGGYSSPALEVGLWKSADDYRVAAYIRYADGFSKPVELLRSGQPIKSATFFPAPDANSGHLYLLMDTGKTVAQLALYWNHDSFSQLLRGRQ